MEEDLPIATKDPRHLARVLAVQYLFTKFKADSSKVDLSYYESDALLDLYQQKKHDRKLYESIVDGVIEHEKDIDEVVQRLAPAWPIDQINPVDLIILRMAIWESNYFKKTPVKVAINEAIEIAKALSSDASGKFINGVLGTLIKEKEENERK